MSDSTQFTMYATTWCPFCSRLRRDLDAEGIAYKEIDVDQDAEAGEVVKSLNGGNRTVPTLVFADGSALTNPSIGEVKAKLEA